MHKVTLLSVFLQDVFKILCYSASGLSRHKSNCKGGDPSKSLSRSSIVCPSCNKTFGEKRYLEQHIGGKKCQQRKEFLQKTASFTLALTDSPSSAATNAKRTLSSTDGELVSDPNKVGKVVNNISLRYIACSARKV